jgi:iron complex transport system substrate-binding protein
LSRNSNRPRQKGKESIVKQSTKAGVAGLFLFLATALAACGSSDESSDTTIVDAVEESTEESTFPVTVGDLTLEAKPERIVSLSPTATEMLYAIGAGSQVVAVDEFSNHPAEAVALGTALSGFEPNIEAISGYEPDLVIISYDPGSLVEQLNSLGIPVFAAYATMDLAGTYEQIEQLGALTGNLAAAVQLTGQMQADIEAAVAGVTVPETPLTYYYELDNTYYSVTSNTFVGQIFALFGLANIADGVEEGNDYPQLSAEVIVSANPDLIFLADTKCCGQTAETVAQRDGWAEMNAVMNGGVVELDDDVASRWGPRIVELVQVIADAVSSAVVSSM